MRINANTALPGPDDRGMAGEETGGSGSQHQAKELVRG